MTTKTCFKCNKELPIESFYPHSAMAGGRLNKCKECAKKDVSKNRYDKRDYYIEYDRKRGGRKTKEQLAEYRKKNPIKNKAHRLLNYAVRVGYLVKQNCEVCGTNKFIHAHHCDYSKPLEVMWLCTQHHKDWHSKNQAINGD